jgi:arylsulfatase A-like enzyme
VIARSPGKLELSSPAWEVALGVNRTHSFVPALAVAVALATGMLEIPLTLLRRDLFLVPIQGDLHIFWMAPLANLVLVTPVALLLWLLEGIRPGAKTERLAVTVLLSLGTFAQLLYLPRAPRWGLAILALGVGVRVSAIAIQRRQWLHRATHRLAVTLPPLLAVYAGLAVAVRPLRERWLNRNLPAASDQAPNILLLVLDTVGANRMSLYGYERETTPALARWAESATLFDLALATSSWTLPSHAGMFTGRYPEELNAGFRTALDNQWPTLAGALAEQGYRTAGFVANRKYASYEFGLNRGFARYEDFRISPGQIMVSSSLGALLVWQPWFTRMIGYYDLYGRKSAAMVNQDFLSWARGGSERPFFAFINYYDAHDPYIPPAPFDRQFTDDSGAYRPLPLSPSLKPAQLRRLLAAHEGALAYLDREIDNLLRQLDVNGILDHTLVILTSDHGEQFGEHGQMEHGNSLYRVLLEVPLVLRFPGRVPTGRRVTDPVTLRDLPATVLDLAGLPNSAGFPGSTLATRWQSIASDSARSPLLSALTWPDGEVAVALRVGNMEYIDWFQEGEQLYDLGDDPAELRNLASKDDTTVTWPYRAALDSLRANRPRAREMGKLQGRLTGTRQFHPQKRR